MHLGRFHAVIDDLARHFKFADLHTKLEVCATALENYTSSKDAIQLDAFRQGLAKFYSAAEIIDPDLLQPYALQVIEDIDIKQSLSPLLIEKVKEIVADRSFDHVGLIGDLRNLGQKIVKKTNSIAAINNAFTHLDVELERVHSEGESPDAEIGLLFPREAVGETLKELAAEFSALNKMFRAINELTGAQDYDPCVRTISSSWWQIFVELDPNQIIVWVLAVERIVGLFKSNLEIKKLQKELTENNISKNITDLLDKEIEEKVAEEINKLASDLRKNHAKITDENRLNEIENQLRFSLRHLAKRINQGGQVEINVALPNEPADLIPAEDGQPIDPVLLEDLAVKRARLKELRDLRQRARLASTRTVEIELDGQLLLMGNDAQGEDIDPLA